MGCYTNSSNNGRCKRCALSEMQDLHGDGRSFRMCTKYGNTCQSVARNCKAPARGYRIVGKTEVGIRIIE